MVGYTESLTDPSYNGQILTLTYPLIGNYGIPGDSRDEHGMPNFFESEKIWASGLIIGDLTDKFSHWSAELSLSEWLEKHKVPGIYGNFRLLDFAFILYQNPQNIFLYLNKLSISLFTLCSSMSVRAFIKIFVISFLPIVYVLMKFYK